MRNGPPLPFGLEKTVLVMPRRARLSDISVSRYWRSSGSRAGFWLSVGIATRRRRSATKAPLSKYFSAAAMAAARVMQHFNRDGQRLSRGVRYSEFRPLTGGTL